MYDLYERECFDVRRSTRADPKCHAITGIGYGGQRFTTYDQSYAGAIWLYGTYEVANGFLDSDGILISKTVDKYDLQTQDYLWKVSTRRNLQVSPGDTIKFHPLYEDAIELPITRIEHDFNGDLSLELGSKSVSQVDALEISEQTGVGYSANYMLESHESISATSEDFYLNDPTHFTAPVGELDFEVPANVKDADLVPRITLELSIDLKTEKLLTVGSCAVELKTDDTYRRFGNIIGWTPGQSIPEIDVTEWITAPAEYDPLYDDESTGTLSLGTWPDGGSKLIIEVSEVTEHTDCEGTICINSPDECITISGAGEYKSTIALSAIPTITTHDLDCHLKITATILNTVSIGVYMADDYEETHISYTGHPALTANGTLRFWKRKVMS